MTDSRILVVGGGTNQSTLAKKAQRRGAVVIVTDSNENPPSKLMADYFYQIDTTDKIETLRIAKHHKITAVVTDQSDAAVPTVAFVAAEMNLPGIGSQTAEVFTNKFVMREILSRSASPYLPSCFRRFTNKSDAINFLQRSGGHFDRFVVKPIDSQGSRGVSRLSNSTADQEIERAFTESRSGTVLLEEFVNGDEFSVDSVIVNGKVTSLAIGRKEHFVNNECLDQRIVFLGSFLNDFRESLVRANQDVLADLGLVTGLAHAEFIMSNKRILLVEVSARGGGAGIASSVVPHISNFDTTDFLLDFATGIQPLQVKTLISESRCAILHFFKPTLGVLTRAEVSLQARQLSREVYLNMGVGSVIADPRDSRSRIGHFIVAGETYREALDLRNVKRDVS